MLQTLKNAWKIPDLRRRILFTLMMLIVFRFGAHIPVPYLTADAMQAFLGNGGTDLFSLFDVFTGGAFSNATVMFHHTSTHLLSFNFLLSQYLLLSVWLKKVLRAERKLTRLQDTLVLRWHSYKVPDFM